MATPQFPFFDDSKKEARLRQEGRCAVCAIALDHVLDFAHHVIPDQCGNPADPTHAWLRTTLNCALLCHNCHVRVHENGNWKNGAVAPPTYFRWSHKKRQAHQVWAKDVASKAWSIWEYLHLKTFRASQ